jgi:hypothetical protein
MEITTVVNENNNFSNSELEYFNKIVENMSKCHHIEILKIIFEKNKKCINEDSDGIHINMEELSDQTIDNLHEYIKCVNLQKNENKFSTIELKNINKIVENMSKFHHTEILKRIFEQNKKCINENNYGIHINMTELSDPIIDNLHEYLKHVNLQENEINNFENKKKNYINAYFST